MTDLHKYIRGYHGLVLKFQVHQSVFTVDLLVTRKQSWIFKKRQCQPGLHSKFVKTSYYYFIM